MEPERRIEKVLRAYAKKRRDEAGAAPELHPATRRLLQDEIARRRPKPAGDGFFASLFASAGRKLAFAACVTALILIGSMLILPSLSGAKYRAQSMSAMSNLKQIGTAIFLFSGESNRMPASLDEIKGQLVSEKTLIDPQSGQQFVYVGGENRSDADPQAMLAYSPVDDRGRFVLFADGHVDKVPSSQFAELLNRTVALTASSSSLNRNQPADMIAASPPPPAQPASAEDKERSDAGKSVADAAGAARLGDRQRELAATEKNRPQPGAAPAPEVEVAARNVAQKPGTITVGGTVAFNEATRETRQGSGVADGSTTNSLDLFAGAQTGDLAAAKENPAPAEVPKSESHANFALAANEPASSTANVEELKAGAKLDFKQAGANDINEASSYAVSQQYVQTVEPADTRLRDKKIPSPVLVSFQVQQSDQNLRVVDQDGSVYNGYWRAADTPDQGRKARQPLPTTPPAASSGLPETDVRAYKDQQQAAQNYFFQVTGTNRSLNQNIVFNGNFTALTSGVPLVQMNGLLNNSFGGGGGAGGLQNKISNQSLQLLLSNSRISGTAIIDNNRQIPINALPATAPR